MSLSTSLTNTMPLYPSTSNDNQRTQDSSVPQNVPQFSVSEYSMNPVCNGSSATYNNPKISNVNHCINSQMNFNPPNYVSTHNPNGLNGQDIRFQNTYTINNPGVMIHGPRNGQFIPSNSSSWAGPVRRDYMISRPTWNIPKPTTNRGVKKPKRIRTAFTSHQMMELENQYARSRYLDRSRRIELSQALKLNERTVKIWFQNRRMKEKKDKTDGNEEIEDIEATSTTESSPELGGPMIMFNPYSNNGVNNRNMYIEQHPAMPQQNNAASFIENVGNSTLNPYPTFVAENNMQLADFEMQCHNHQINMQMENYSIDDENDVQINNQQETQENSTNGSGQNVDDGGSWDLSWLRSLNFDEDA